jgi:dihydrofolate reductase
MRKLVQSMSVSLDGFMEGPGHDIGWHHVDEELHRHFNEELAAMSLFLDGRVTWELMAGYWPTADRNPDASPAEVEFAGIWRDKPKYMYSTRLRQAEWNTTVLPVVDADDIRALKREPGGDMAVGGATLAAEFTRLGLIDEYWLYVNPVVLGEGTPFFGGTRPSLSLIESRPFANGVVKLSYAAAAN